MRKAAVRHPIFTSVIVTVIFFVLMQLGGLLLFFSPSFFKSNGQLLQQTVADAVVALGGILLALIFGYANKFYRTEKFWTGVCCSGFFIVIYTISGVASVMAEIETMGAQAAASRVLPFYRLLIWPLCTLMIGIAEETFFRGIVANLFWDKHAKDPAGVWTATIYSGMIFGCMHLMNLLGAEPSGVFSQVVAACALGIAMTAVYYRCRNLWVMILLHAFMDFCGLSSVGIFGGSIQSEISGYNIFSTIVGGLPYIIVALVLLRKKKVIALLSGENAVGYIPQQQPGQLILGVDMPSSDSSKRSLRRAIVVYIVATVLLLTAGIATDPAVREMVDDVTGSYIVDYEDSGEWTADSDVTFAHGIKFDVDEAGTYEINVITNPSSSLTDMVVQIVKDGETVYQSSYGGKNNTNFGVKLGEGVHEIKVAYSFANVKDDTATYSTRVRIKKD